MATKKKKVSKYKGFSGVTGKQVKSTVSKKPKKRVALTEGGKNIAIKPSGKTYSGKNSLRNAGKGPKPAGMLGKKYGGKSPFKNIGASGKIKGPKGNIDPKTGRKRVVKKKSTRSNTRNFV
jgi:hypothetical protein